jgi:hypothetical protein
MRIPLEFVVIISVYHILAMVVGAILVNLMARREDVSRPRFLLSPTHRSGDYGLTTLTTSPEQDVTSGQHTESIHSVPTMPGPRTHVYSQHTHQPGLRRTVIYTYRSQSALATPPWVSSTWWRRRDEPQDDVTWTSDSPAPPTVLPPMRNDRGRSRSENGADDVSEPGKCDGKR